MLNRLTIYLTENERMALEKLGKIELRPMRDQAQYIIRQDLEKRGLLEPQHIVNISNQTKDQEAGNVRSDHS